MRKKEGNHARMFAGVVVVFMICQIPDVALKAMHIVQYFVDDPPICLLIWVKVRDLCLLLNSAVNIIIYTSMSKEFRTELREAFHKFIRGTFIFTGRPHISAITSNSVLENSVLQGDPIGCRTGNGIEGAPGCTS